MVFHWSLSDSKSRQVSRTLLSILTNLNNAVIWMVCTCPLITKSHSPCYNPLVTPPSPSITIDFTVTFMFQGFFSSLARSRYLSLFLFFFFSSSRFFSVVSRNYSAGSFFFFFFLLFYWLSLGLVVWPRLDYPFVFQNPKEFCTPHSLGKIPGWTYTIYSYSQI